MVGVQEKIETRLFPNYWGWKRIWRRIRGIKPASGVALMQAAPNLAEWWLMSDPEKTERWASTLEHLRRSGEEGLVTECLADEDWQSRRPFGYINANYPEESMWKYVASVLDSCEQNGAERHPFRLFRCNDLTELERVYLWNATLEWCCRSDNEETLLARLDGDNVRVGNRAIICPKQATWIKMHSRLSEQAKRRSLPPPPEPVTDVTLTCLKGDNVPLIVGSVLSTSLQECEHRWRELINWCLQHDLYAELGGTKLDQFVVKPTVS